MRSRIESAKGVLLYCKDRRSECPGWWTAMQTVALAEGWDWKTYSGLLDEAMKQEPTYQSFYDNAAYFLLPRWHGDPGAIDDLDRPSVPMHSVFATLSPDPLFHYACLQFRGDRGTENHGSTLRTQRCCAYPDGPQRFPPPPQGQSRSRHFVREAYEAGVAFHPQRVLQPRWLGQWK